MRAFNKITTVLMAATLIFFAVFNGASFAAGCPADGVKFPDVPKNHWAYSTIQWAVDNDVVNGYPDGTFRPSQHVTEAEFLVMFIREFDELPNVTPKKHWADPAYKVAIDKNWPVRGVAFDSPARNTVVTRGTVAEIIAGASGVNFLGKDAIQYLLNTELSKGKTSATVEGYGADDFLTRAEAVQFIKNVKDKGLSELKERPDLPTPKEEMPPAQKTIPQEIQKVATALEQYMEGKPAYEGYKVLASDNGVSVTKGTRTGIGYEIPDPRWPGGTTNINVWEASNSHIVNLAIELMIILGVPVDDADKFSTEIQQQAILGATSKVEFGNYKVTVRPHSTNVDILYIEIKK